jgi:hypothetical protein
MPDGLSFFVEKNSAGEQVVADELASFKRRTEQRKRSKTSFVGKVDFFL